MDYLDFDLEIGEGRRREYPLSARCQGSQASVTLRFPFDELALRDHLKDLRIALLRSGGPPRRSLSPEAQTVQTFGQRLFDALLAGDVRALYDVSRRDADQRGDGLRLKLHIKAPDLATLPWEYLYDDRAGEYLCLSALTPLVRYLDLPRSAQPLLVQPPLRILGVVASPSDLEQLDIKSEQRRIEKALASLKASGLVRMTWLEGQTWRDLRRALLDETWHIIHFIGHGGFDPNAQEGVIALANEEGKRHLLTATKMGDLLAGHRSLRLVLLNACSGARAAENDLFSSTAATLARRGIPAVLAMQEEITDHAAIEFTRSFYDELARSRPVDAAVVEARKAIYLSVNNSLEWGTPVLYMRALDGKLFDLSEEKKPLTTRTPATKKPVAQQRAAPELSPPPATPEQLLAEYELAVKRNPQDAQAQRKLAAALNSLKRYGEALAAYDHALALGDYNPATYYGRGRTLSNLKRFEDALDDYDRAIILDATMVAAWIGKGEALNALGRFQEALNIYDRAIQMSANSSRAWTGKGEVLSGLQRYADAITACDQALRLDPGNAQALLCKAEALMSLNEVSQALACYQDAIQLDPTSARAYRGKGTALHMQQQHGEALIAYSAAIQLDPNDPQVYLTQGTVLESLGWQQEALNAYDQAIRLAPTLAQAYRRKGKLLADPKFSDKALEASKQAEADNPPLSLPPFTASNKALKPLKLPRWPGDQTNADKPITASERALEALKRADELDPNHEGAFLDQARLLTASQRYKEALTLWELLLQRFPKDREAFQNRAALSNELKRQEDANRNKLRQQQDAKPVGTLLVTLSGPSDRSPSDDSQPTSRASRIRRKVPDSLPGDSQPSPALPAPSNTPLPPLIPSNTPLPPPISIVPGYPHRPLSIFGYPPEGDKPGTTFAWSPDGARLISSHSSDTLLWDAVSGQLIATLKGLGSVAWSPDGQRIASSSAEDGTVTLWDATSGKPLTTLSGHAGTMIVVAWSPDGRHLASSNDDNGIVTLWDATSGKPLTTLRTPTEAVLALAWAPYGQYLALGGADQTVSLWDTASGTQFGTLKSQTQYSGHVTSVAWSPDGTRLTSAINDWNIDVWDLASGQLLATLKGLHREAVWSPDKQLLAEVGNKHIRLWDALSGKPFATLRGHTGWVHSVAWSPDGQRLASTGSDQYVRIWDVPARNDWTTRWRDALSGSTQHLSYHLNQHANSIAWSPDGRHFAAAGGGEVYLWGGSRLWSGSRSGNIGSPLLLLNDHSKPVHAFSNPKSVNAISWSPDGTRLATAGYEKGHNTVWIWKM